MTRAKLIETKRRAVEAQIGKRIVIRGIRTLDPALRGRVTERQGYVLLEYQVAQPGYFWEVPVVEALLDRIAAGERELIINEPV